MKFSGIITIFPQETCLLFIYYILALYYYYLALASILDEIKTPSSNACLAFLRPIKFDLRYFTIEMEYWIITHC
jgi:hypothetical protein